LAVPPGKKATSAKARKKPANTSGKLLRKVFFTITGSKILV
jgi:hypothetical protein